MSIRKISIFFGLLLPLSSSAFIYHTQVLRRWMPESNAYQYVIGLSDYHDKEHQASMSQRFELERLLSICDAQHTQVLVEDLSSKNNIGRQTCGNFKVDSRGGILGGLDGVCKKMDLSVANVEYRYCRVAAFGPILNGLNAQLGALRSPNTIRIQAIIDEIMHEIKHIHAYQDVPAVLRPDFARHEAQVLKKIQRLQLYKYKNSSAAHYIAQLSKPSNRVDLLTQLLTFDSPLLDLKMVQSIINAKNKNTIVAIAGGTHIKNIGSLLKKMGYQEVYASSIAKTNEYNLQKCLGSHIINGSYCVKPKPIDLDVVKKFLK